MLGIDRGAEEVLVVCSFHKRLDTQRGQGRQRRGEVTALHTRRRQEAEKPGSKIESRPGYSGRCCLARRHAQRYVSNLVADIFEIAKHMPNRDIDMVVTTRAIKEHEARHARTLADVEVIGSAILILVVCKPCVEQGLDDPQCDQAAAYLRHRAGVTDNTYELAATFDTGTKERDEVVHPASGCAALRQVERGVEGQCSCVTTAKPCIERSTVSSKAGYEVVEISPCVESAA